MAATKLLSRVAVALVATSLLVACGSDSDGDTTAAGGSGSASAAATGDAFPVTIEHKYGSTTVEAAPERVVSVGYTDQDFLLAVGVVPVGIRDWYGDQPYAVWPWAQDALGDAQPEVLDSSELNYEAIAALRPDLIVGVSSGMTEDEYETLSAIAPTITQTADYLDYGLPWEEGQRMVGAAVGQPDEAEALIAGIESQYEAIRAAHPDWDGDEGTVSYVLSESEVGAYSSQDTRSRVLTDLGLVIPPEIDEIAGDQFYSEFSLEELGRLDRGRAPLDRSRRRHRGASAGPPAPSADDGRRGGTGDLPHRAARRRSRVLEPTQPSLSARDARAAARSGARRRRGDRSSRRGLDGSLRALTAQRRGPVVGSRAARH